MKIKDAYYWQCTACHAPRAKPSAAFLEALAPLPKPEAKRRALAHLEQHRQRRLGTTSTEPIVLVGQAVATK